MRLVDYERREAETRSFLRQLGTDAQHVFCAVRVLTMSG